MADLIRYMRAHRTAAPRAPRPLSTEERAALRKLRAEARASGSFLGRGGKGGLPPSLVLGVMRRDRYTCKVCGELGDKEGNGGVGVHHKGGVVASRWLANKGHRNEPGNLVTICERCHDNVHERARDEGVDGSQVEAAADKE